MKQPQDEVLPQSGGEEDTIAQNEGRLAVQAEQEARHPRVAVLWGFKYLKRAVLGQEELLSVDVVHIAVHVLSTVAV
jgi:hypothetical protein